jgi:hypothetical protein
MKHQKYLSDGNSKYKDSKVKVLTWGIPALRSKTGVITCPGAGICGKLCYAQQGRMAMKNCTQAQEKRLKLAESRDFVPEILHELYHRQWDILRIHDVGDFYNEDYLRKWLGIMAFFPEKTFFAYTKNIPLFKKYAGAIPKNFHVVFSLGGKWDSMVNDAKDNHAKIFETLKDAEDSGYEPSPNEFPLSMNGGGVKEALIYHGNKSWGTALGIPKVKKPQ